MNCKTKRIKAETIYYTGVLDYNITPDCLSWDEDNKCIKLTLTIKHIIPAEYININLVI